MSKARLIITAVTLEGRSPTEVARAYGVARSWVYALVARYRVEGEAAFEPRSRRPSSRPHTTPTAHAELVIDLRRRLTADGLDAGADTIAWHLEHHHRIRLSRATIYRIIRRAGLVTPEPKKKPKASYIRFQAEQPNETWQSDFTHWRLADGTDTEILTWLDDHSRYALSVTAHQPVTGPAVVTTFRTAITRHGTPFSTLTDNGLVFTARFANGSRTSRNALENELVKHRVRQKNSRPNHPTTCGKVERFQQTMKRWLTARPKATPDHHADSQHRVRHDRIADGKVSLRHDGRLFHIGIGHPHNGTPVVLLIKDLDIRVIHATTGEILRALTLDTTRNYQPTGAKRGGPSRPYGPYGPRKKQQPEPH